MFFSLCVTLSLVASLVGLIYVFLTWDFDYWKKRGIKGPKPRPFYGNFPNMVNFKRHPCYDMLEIYKQYKQDEDFVGVFSIRTPHLMVLSPEFMNKVLVSEFKNFHDNEAVNWVDVKTDKILRTNPFVLRGEEWKVHRQEITPGLTVNRIKGMYPVTMEVCERLIKYLKNVSSKSDPDGVNAKDLSLRFTSEVVTDCVLGLKADSLSDNPTPILGMTKQLFEGNLFFSIYAFLSGLWPKFRLIYQMKFFKKNVEEFFIDLCQTSIDMRMRQKVDRMDFLNYVLQMQEKKQLDSEGLLSRVMTFLIDGFETTATVITSTLLQLAKNPAAQEQVRQEILNNLLTNDGELDFDKLEGPSFLDQCIHESMRIIPPVLFYKKLCSAPCELTSRNGLKIKLNPEDIVLLPAHAICHDPQYFPNPDEFHPERFSEENGGVKKYKDLGLFFPFGSGPRTCLGMKFALIQVKAAVAEIVRNFDIKLNSKTQKGHSLVPTGLVGELEGGVWLNFQERN